MTPFPDYKTATNAAYRLLAEMDTFSIQTDVFGIANNLPNCRVFSYGLTNYLHDGAIEALLANSEYGFSVKKHDNRIIYFNERMPLWAIRFTLAHEIGHAVLKHQDEDDPIAEKEANCFARNLLCPLPIANGLAIRTESDYASAFNIGTQMARATVGRRSSDAYYIDDLYTEILDDRLYAYILGYDSLSDYKRLYASA